jgi:hypothetical protein
MNINRHNYEEFFLLYVDRELSAAERDAVTVFVEENPDLKTELDILMESIAKKESFIFENKNALLRKDSITVLQHQLLLYLDKELSAKEAVELEKLMATDAGTTKEFVLLEQTKLQVDPSIVFYDKALLYKKEGGKIVYLPWRKIAIAAILLGFGIWIGMQFVKTGRPGNGVENFAKENLILHPEKKQADTTTREQLADKKDQVKDINTLNSNSNNKLEASMKKNSRLPDNNNKAAIILPKDQNMTVVNKIEKIPAPRHNQPGLLQNNNANSSNKNDVASVLTQVNNSGNNKAVNPSNPIDNSQKASTSLTTNDYAMNASFTESNTDEKNEDGFFTLSSERVNKTRLGGFLRKVKRVFDRTTSIKTGNSIKIAGFDIAIK